jgi:hypothetical protein
MTEGNELDEILALPDPSSAPTTEATVTTTETTTQQQRDEAGRFAATAANTPPVEQQTTDTTEPGVVEGQDRMVPQQALHAARQREKTAQERADRLEAMLEQALQRAGQPQQVTPQTEKPKPKDIWEDPEGFARNAVTEALTPVQTQMRQFVFTTSKREATREFGAETITAAEEAMKAAVANGTLDRRAVAAELAASMDPVGDVVRWHKKSSAISRVGDDPDAWFEAELAKREADPAYQAKFLERIRTGSTSASNANGQTPLTKLPPSLSRIPGGGNAVADNDASSGAIFDRVTAGR